MRSRGYPRSWRNFIFRQGPVPFIGKCSPYCWHRTIRTTNELRANAGLGHDDDAAGVWARGSRRPHNLPTSWDDIVRCAERTWKRHRLTQYKT